MTFGAIDQFYKPRRDALPPPVSQSTTGSSAVPTNERLPRLRGNTEGIQIGPDRDVFQKNTAQTPLVEKPAGVSAKPATEKTGASSWLQSIKNMLPAKGESVKVEKPSNAASSTFTDTMVGKAQKPNSTMFAAAKINALKKPEQSGLASMLMSVASLSSLVSLVAGPAALVAKPGLVNSVVSTLPAKLP